MKKSDKAANGIFDRDVIQIDKFKIFAPQGSIVLTHT